MSIKAIVEIIVLIMILSGTMFSLLSSLGFIRLPDVYTRSHAATKSATLGVLCILLGTFVYFLFEHHFISIRLLLGIIFVFLTAPVAAHLIIRSAHRVGTKLSDTSVKDELTEDLEKLAAKEKQAVPQMDQ